jgi:hypothetical protein
MTDRLDDLLQAMPTVDPGPAFTGAVMAALPRAPRSASLHHGRWMLAILAAGLLVLWGASGPEAGPRLLMLRHTLTTLDGLVQAMSAEVQHLAGSLPWSLVTRSVYAVASGMLIAWGVPALPLALARRRIPTR